MFLQGISTGSLRGCRVKTNGTRGFAMVLVILIVAVLSVMSLALLDRHVSSSALSRERENLIRVLYVNQAAKEHALWYLKNNPSTVLYTSALIDLQGLAWDLQGQFRYQIEDVTPEESDPVKKFTITGYYPSEEEAAVQKQYHVYVADVDGDWVVRSEFQPER